ncbi:MAG: PilN domain-containing protein [Methylococcales bacterium]|nr:PilN domain-containing protein [Methylococcales bacterium]
MQLDTQINLDVAAFWRWWRNELAFLVPERLRAWLDDRAGVIVITLQDEQLTVQGYHRQQQQLIGHYYPASGTAIAQLLSTLDDQPLWRQAPLGLRLPGSAVLCKSITVPKAAQAHLQQLLDYELDRLTPFTSEQVYYAYQAAPAQAGADQLDVTLLISPKSRLESLLGEFKTQGRALSWIDSTALPSHAEQGPPRYNLLPLAEQQSLPLLPKLVQLALTLTLLILLTGLLVLPLRWQQAQVEALEQQLKTLASEAQQVEAQELAMTKLVEHTQQLLAKKHHQPSALAVLDSLSQLINDDTWLTYFQYRNGRVQFQGQSPQASRLIAMLENAPWFKDVSFASPVNQDIRTGLERFQINAQLTLPPSE